MLLQLALITIPHFLNYEWRQKTKQLFCWVSVIKGDRLFCGSIFQDNWCGCWRGSTYFWPLHQNVILRINWWAMSPPCGNIWEQHAGFDFIFFLNIFFIYLSVWIKVSRLSRFSSQLLNHVWFSVLCERSTYGSLTQFVWHQHCQTLTPQ